MKSPRGGYFEQHCSKETKEETKSSPRISFPVWPRHSQGISDAFPQSGNCGAQNQSKTVQRKSLQWETLKSWHSYRDIQPGFARTIFYKLSMCLLWKENMFQFTILFTIISLSFLKLSSEFIIRSWGYIFLRDKNLFMLRLGCGLL